MLLIAGVLWGLGLSAQITLTANTTSGCSPLPVVISVATPAAPAITSYQWAVTFPAGNTVNSTDTQFIGVFTQPGQYSVTVTINGSQTHTETGFITVHQPPTAAIAVDPPVGCVPHCVQYSDASVAGSGQIVAWSWDFGNGALSNQQNPQYCYTNPGNYTPFLSVTDEFGCFNSVSVPQLVSVSNQLPVASFTPDILSDCNPPSTVTFENTSTGNGLTSSWNFGNGFSQTTVTPSTVTTTFNALGNFNVCLTVTNDIGCEAVSCQTISVVAPPTPTFTISDASICAGGFVQFTSTTTPVPNNLQWDFNGDGVIDATGTPVFYAYDSPGVYSPVLTAAFSANCIGVSGTGTTVEVLEPLGPMFVADATVACQVPFTVNFTNESTGQNVVGYEWLINGQSVGNTTDLTHTFEDAGVFDVSLVMESAQCIDTLTIDDLVTVQLPTVTFTLPAQICTGVPVPINNLTINSPDPVTSIDWDFNADGEIDATGPNPNFSYDTPGIYQVTVYIETQSGCTNVIPATANITVQPGVIADFTSNTQTSCAGEPITFCANGMVPNTIYGWNFGVGGWQNVSFPNECVTYTYQDTGYFDITLSVYNTACNALIVLQDYIYIPPPVANFTFQQDCADLNQFNFTSTSLGADSLVWNFGDGSPLVYNDETPSHTFPGPGTYSVTLLAYNYETGCEDDKVINVNNIVNPIVLNVLNPAGCGPHTTGFSSPNTQQYVAWSIDFGNGATATATLGNNNVWAISVTQANGTVINYTNSLNVNWWPQITFANQGIYDITITATDPGGCTYTYTYPNAVTVYNDPVFAQFDAVIVDDCDQVIVNFVPTGNFLTNGQWTFGDGTVVNGLEVTHEFEPPWNYPFSASFSVSDSFGCGSQTSVTLPIVAPPIAGFEVVSDPSCIAEVISLTNTSIGAVNYSWDFGDPQSPLNISTAQNPEFAYENNGSYTICLTAENSAGCQQTVCFENAVNIISPVAEISFTPQIANCLFGVQFQNTTEGDYLCSDWSFGDGQYGGGPSPYHTYSIGVYDVQLVVCNEFGCYDTTTVFDIFNLANVIGPFNQTLDTIDCAPFQVEFSAFNVNDQAFTYFWDFGDGSGDPNNNTITGHSYLTPGSYCPTLVMQDPNGCTFLQTCDEPIVVTQFTFEMSTAAPVCFGESTLFTVSGAQSYTFNQPELVTELDAEMFSVLTESSTQLLVTGQLADCQYTLPLEVVVHPLPIVGLDLEEGVCFNAPPFALTGGWPSNGSYTVNGLSALSFDPSMPPGNLYEVAYSFSDQNGCVNADTSFIEIWELPVVALEPIADLCELDGLFALTGGSPLGGSYSVNGLQSDEFDPAQGYGAYSVVYTFSDDNLCSANDVTSFAVFPSPVPSVSPPILCWAPELTIESTTTIAQGSISQHSWNLGGHGPDSGTSTATLTTDGPGVIDVTLTVISDQGCQASVDVEIPVYATPEADFSVDAICQDDQLVFVESSTTDGDPIATWSWALNNETFSSSQQPDPLTMPDWGVFNVSLTVVSPEGCEDTYSTSVDVSPLPLIDLVTQTICAGEQAVVFSNVSAPDGGAPDLIWSNGLGDNAITTTNLSQVYVLPGDYVVVLTASSGPGCESVESITVTVHPVPEPSFLWDETRFCANGSTHFVDDTDIAWGTISGWAWAANGQTFATGPEATFTTSEPGTYTISLAVMSNEGCMAQITESGLIQVWPNPVADFYYPPDLPSTPAPYIHVTDRSEGAESWLYTISDGASYTEPDFTHTFTSNGEFAVWQFVTNAFGCTDSLELIVDFNPELNIYVPNAFTPDGDGLNELFKPVLSGAELNHYRFFIVNRWGETVFESGDPSEGWQGNFRGGDHYVPGGVYVWQLEVGTRDKFVPEMRTGHVTVVR